MWPGAVHSSEARELPMQSLGYLKNLCIASTDGTYIMHSYHIHSLQIVQNKPAKYLGEVIDEHLI